MSKIQQRGQKVPGPGDWGKVDVVGRQALQYQGRFASLGRYCRRL